MKYFLSTICCLVLVVFLGYKYFEYKMIDAQENSFIELAASEFEESPRFFPDSVRMNDSQFWSLIDKSKVKYPDDFDGQMDYLTQQLSKLSNHEIIGFEATLKEKVIELWNYNVKSLYQIMFGNYLSTDGFIYFRFWLISNGRDFYQKALYDPEQLSDRIEASYNGERLMVVADDAFEIKNGSENGISLPRDLTADISYDDGNYKMSGDYIAPGDFKKKFPKLVDKF